MSHARSMFLVFVAALALSGCVRRHSRSGASRVAPRQEQQLAAQASRELSCPQPSLAVTALSDRVYQVHGCGQLRDYALSRGRQPGWFPLQPVYMRAATEMACPVSQMEVAAPTATLRTATGCGRTARYDLVCGSIECAWMMTAHGGAWAGEAAAAAPIGVTGVALGPSATIATEGAAIGGAGATTAPSSEADALAIPEPPAAGSPEAVIRAALDAGRAAIHRCAGQGIVQVRARWDASGTVTFALPPPLEGSTAEGCVRTAMGAHRIPATAAGEVVHPVQ